MIAKSQLARGLPLLDEFRDLPWDVVIPKQREFLGPVPAAAVENAEFDAIWKPGGPWRSSRRKM
jgi:hypothetical protein